MHRNNNGNYLLRCGHIQRITKVKVKWVLGFAPDSIMQCVLFVM